MKGKCNCGKNAVVEYLVKGKNQPVPLSFVPIVSQRCLISTDTRACILLTVSRLKVFSVKL